MHVISRRILVQFWGKYPDAEGWLALWHAQTERAKWTRWADVQAAHPKASYVGCCLVFNVLGGKYRLVTRRSRSWKTLFVVGAYTHAEYDRKGWQARCQES